MKKRLFVCTVALAGFLAVKLVASGQAGIYGVVERVVFELGKEAPDRVQVWGAFALVEHVSGAFTNYHSTPSRGYLYFKLPEATANIENARREWADLSSVAGTRQAVAFGYYNRFRGDTLVRIRDSAAKPENPDPYYTDIGVTKLGGGHADIVAKLLKLVPPSTESGPSAARR